MPDSLNTTTPSSVASPIVISRRLAIHASIGGLVALATGVQGVVAHRQVSGELTFVVAGLDSREGHPNHNSDVLLVSRVDLNAGAVRSMSIPRDLYVEIPGFGQDKITRAFDYGYQDGGERWDAGADMLVQTIEQNFDLDIDGVVTTTFEGFEKITDAVGGVEIDNPYEVIGFGDVESFPEGVQTLTGEEALVFVRTRYQDSDNGRVMRQQLVLDALLARLRDPAIVQDLPALVMATRGAVETNIPMETQLRLVAVLPSLSRENVDFATMTDHLTGGTLDNGMWVYQGDWHELPGIVQAYLAGS